MFEFITTVIDLLEGKSPTSKENVQFVKLEALFND